MPPKPQSSTPKVSVRRPTNQPKSSRQQFSACGACRIRRVRCDLKDLPDSKCSNCQEHGFNCVDEYRDVKAVKLLRRGRRIQQVEAVYGAGPSSDPEAAPTSIPASSSNHSIIPRLQPQFFESRFYPRFHIQRPIIEPEEFKARYIAFFDGNLEALVIPGQLIAMLLVVWAASYGVDEYGREEPHDGAQGVRRRKQRTNEMVNELLHLIDIHGLPRKPSWDGVRVLLLIMPLTEEVADPLERLTMYETAINQVYTLCSIASPRSVNSGQGEYVDALVRARIYWYAFVHEGITTGLRGGRLHLADDDLKTFQMMQDVDNLPLARSQLTLTYSHRWALAPLRLAVACREVHSALTGSKARSQPEVDEKKLNQAWESIETCWEEFESLRSLGRLGILTVEEADRFVDGWKIFIFECHNVIREFLKQRLVSLSGRDDSGYLVDIDSQRTLSSIHRLHAIAESKCNDVVQHVVSLVRRHIGSSFFEYDASLVRDGCFFAGYILAGENDMAQHKDTCLQALAEMRWAFSKSEERTQTLKLISEARSASRPRKECPTTPSKDLFQQSGGEPSHQAMPHGSESHTWSGLAPWNRPRSTSVPSSPNDPSASHLLDEEHTNHSCSMSSGSSCLSSNSPYTPNLGSVAPNLYSFHLNFDGKAGHATRGHGQGVSLDQRPLLAATTPGTQETSDACYQYAGQQVVPQGLLHNQAQHPNNMEPSPHSHGPDVLEYSSPVSVPHGGNLYTHNPPYYYS